MLIIGDTTGSFRTKLISWNSLLVSFKILRIGLQCRSRPSVVTEEFSSGIRRTPRPITEVCIRFGIRPPQTPTLLSLVIIHSSHSKTTPSVLEGRARERSWVSNGHGFSINHTAWLGGVTSNQVIR